MKQVIAQLSNRQWYHQRFDGSPMYIAMIGESETKKESRKPRGTEATLRVCFFDHGKADWYLDQADIDRGAKLLSDLAISNTAFSKQLMKQWQRDEQTFTNYFTRFGTMNLIKRSDQSLYREFERYHRLSINRFTSSALIDHFALGTDQQISDMLRREVGSLHKESDFNQVFSVATAPVHQSFINEAEIALLKIAIAVKNGASLQSAAIQKQLLQHQASYYWTKNNYTSAHILDTTHFEQEIAAWLFSAKDLEEELQNIEQTPKRNLEAKSQLFKQYRFSKPLRALLAMSEDFTKWQDDRKRATYLCIDMGSTLLDEMARRLAFDPALTRYLLPRHEVKKWFVDHAIDEAELKTRRDSSCIIWQGNKQFVYQKAKADSIRQAMFSTKTDDVPRDIRGLVAATGKAIGIARIVMSVDEIGKVGEGDILIAVMTRPDYVPAMKKCAAIVTDEGGITSHAAIVARELRVPCIIGTKIATKTFKDGDTIEVNANHNWVRKIQV